MRGKYLRNAVLIILVFAVGFVWGSRFGPQIQWLNQFFDNSPADAEELDIEQLKRVFQYVKAFHVDPDLDVQQMSDNAIKGMLREVDGGYTRYETAEEHRRFEEQSITGEYAGIGIVVTMIDNQVVVVSPYKGTPADQAGIGPGDKIVGVNGKSIRDLTLSEVGELIRGPVGTKVRLTIIPDGKNQPIEIEVKRDRIEIPVVEHQLCGQVGYVRLIQFNQKAPGQLTTAIDDLRAQGAEALLLDLRGNPGGLLSVCEEIADLFLDKNLVIVKTVDRSGKEKVAKTTKNQIYNMPMAILINKGSASASEVLSGALRDHQRATLLGTISFGKGTVQRGYSLPGGAMVWITTHTYRTPAGSDIDKKGLTPDVLIPAPSIDTSDWTAKQLEQYQLEKAIEWVNNNLLEK